MTYNIIWLGDSITLGVRTGVVEQQTFAYLVSQQRGASYLNKGIAGDTSTGMLARFSVDVMANSPLWVNIMAGHNDYGAGISVSTYESNLRSMIEQALHGNIRGCLMTGPLPTDATLRVNLPAYNAVTRKLARVYGLPLIDVYQRFADWSFNPGGATYAGYLLDTEHLAPAGHAALAALLSLPEYADALVIPAPSIVAGISGGSAGWQIAAGPITPDRQAAWNSTLRQVISASALLNTGLNQIRVTYQAGSSPSLVVTDAFVGYNSSGYGFDAAPVRLTFSGSNGFTLAANGQIMSDAGAFSIPSGKNLVIATHVSSGYASGKSAATAGWSGYYKDSVNDASNALPSGYSASTDSADGIILVETSS